MRLPGADLDDLLTTEIVNGRTLADLLTLEFVISVFGSVLAAILILITGFVIGGWLRGRLMRVGVHRVGHRASSS